MVYRVHKFMLSKSQLKKVKRALDENEPYNLTINKNNLHGEHPLPITEAEEKAIQSGEGVKVTLSKKKLAYMKNEKEGGFLPLLPLLAGLGALGSLAGGSAAIAQAVNKNKADKAAAEEQARHNKEVETQLKSTGSGMTEALNSNDKNSYTIFRGECGRCGAVLNLKAKKGLGLYLKPYSDYSEGNGLLTRVAGKELPPPPNWLKSIPGIGSVINAIY